MTSYCIRRVGTEAYCSWQDAILFWSTEKHRHTFTERQHALDHIIYVELVRPHLKGKLEVVPVSESPLDD